MTPNELIASCAAAACDFAGETVTITPAAGGSAYTAKAIPNGGQIQTKGTDRNSATSPMLVLAIPKTSAPDLARNDTVTVPDGWVEQANKTLRIGDMGNSRNDPGMWIVELR